MIKKIKDNIPPFLLLILVVMILVDIGRELGLWWQ